jgi:hypothetical protein
MESLGSVAAALAVGIGQTVIAPIRPEPGPARTRKARADPRALDFFLFCKRISDLEFSSKYKK